MVNLDFIIDEKVLEKEKKNPPRSDSNTLGIRFMMPISFVVNTVEICKFSNGSRASIALLDLATTGLWTIEHLKDGQKITYDAMEDAGNYYFTREGDYVHISSNINDSSATAQYAELLSAFENFAQKVRDFLRKEFPDIVNNSLWGPWFKGEKKYLM